MSKKIIIGVLLSVLIIGQLTTVSSASEMTKGREFNVNYAEPSTSDNQGYITLYVVNTSGVYGVVTYFWNTIASASGYDSPSYAYITLSSSEIKFQVAGSSGASGFYSLTQIGMTGNWWNIKNSSSEPFTYNFADVGMTVLGYHYKGNVGTISGMTMSTNPFTVYFNADASATLLRDVWDIIHATYYQNEEIISELESLYTLQSNRLSQVVSWLETINANSTITNSKLDSLIMRGNDILNEQKKTNTWLEKIFNYLNESAEKQKQDAQTQGNNSTSQGMDAIEDKGGDFASSLGGLTNSMSYSGTQCAWEFPEVKLPAIPGVMNEMVLIKKQPIDFAVWVNAIPSDILLVVQSLCTVGLIIYCFKELYSTIAYVLTLRKDDNS